MRKSSEQLASHLILSPSSQQVHGTSQAVNLQNYALLLVVASQQIHSTKQYQLASENTACYQQGSLLTRAVLLAVLSTKLLLQFDTHQTPIFTECKSKAIPSSIQPQLRVTSFSSKHVYLETVIATLSCTDYIHRVRQYIRYMLL